MKNEFIKFRVTDIEKDSLLHQASLAGLSVSDYCRNTLTGVLVTEGGLQQEALRIMCQLYRDLDVCGCEQLTTIRKELSDLCQSLNS